MATVPQLPEDIESTSDLAFWVQLNRAAEYLTLACAVFLIHEWFRTMCVGSVLTLQCPRLPCDSLWEIKYVWKRGPWMNVTKALFYINRYYTLVVAIVRATVVLNPRPTSDVCQHALSFTAFSYVLIVVTIEVILMLRVWAIYGQSKRMGAFLVFIWVAGVTGSVILYVVQIPPLAFVAASSPSSLHPCPNSPSSLYLLIFFIACIVEALCFYLLVRKAHRLARGSRTLLISALVLHGAVYFTIAFCSFLFTVISQLIQVLAQPVQYSNFAVVFASTACTRLVLSLQHLGAQPVFLDQFEMKPRRLASEPATAQVPETEATETPAETPAEFVSLKSISMIEEERDEEV